MTQTATIFYFPFLLPPGINNEMTSYIKMTQFLMSMHVVTMATGHYTQVCLFPHRSR